MRKLAALLSLVAGLFAQNSNLIPFDWAGQNGIVITDGALFWNQVGRPECYCLTAPIHPIQGDMVPIHLPYLNR